MADNTKYVSLGSISRDGGTYKVKHTVKKDHAKSIDYVLVEWSFDGSKADKTTKHDKESKSDREDSIKPSRTSYYPEGSRGKLKSVKARAIGRVSTKDKNGKTVIKSKGAWSDYVTFTPAKPKKPKVSKSINGGTVTFTIETEHPKTGKKECYDTRYVIKQSGNAVTDKTVADKSGKNEKLTPSHDVPEATSLTQGKYAIVSCQAHSRGLGGHSEWVWSRHVFAKPYPPTISSATLSGNKQTGTVVVKFSLDKKKTTLGKKNKYTVELAPVDSVQLWRLQSEVTTATEAANAQGWDEVSMGVDNGTVSGLQDNARDADPVEAGMHVWYMVEAKHDNLSTFSKPIECKDLYKAKSSTSAGNVDVSFLDAGDGWVKLHVVDSETDDDAVRVYWSDYEEAWSSTSQPDSFDVDWLSSGQADVYVRDLENGTRYYFRARAVDTDSEGKEVLGRLSNKVDATPSSDSGTVSTVVPQNVGIGEPLTVSWSFSSDMKQESAEVLVGGKVVASADGSAAEATVAAESLEEFIGMVVPVVVRVHAGGSAFSSEESSVVVANTPSCSVIAPTLTMQPMAFTITTDSPNSPTCTAYIISHGFSGTGFDGDSPQVEGDCVWSDEIEPVWTGNGPYTTTVEVPEGTTFWESASYTVAASLHDPVTTLDSEEASATFGVEWAHQADAPVGTVEVDEEALTAIITVDKPTGDDGGDGYHDGDRFDLYRVSVDGDRRIARNLVFGTVVTDQLAPFGRGANLRYIAVTRTLDGDWSPSADIPYQLDGGALRFDWGDERSLELPFNIEDSTGYEKGYAEETSLDGENVGWWDGSSKRKSSLKTALIKLQSADQEEAIAEMAQYAGPIFVRTPSGAAFPANVVPSDISRGYMTKEIAVSIECAEVAMTTASMPSRDDIVAPEWNGGALYAYHGEVYDATGHYQLDTWTFLGYSGQTLYVLDPGSVVMSGSGSEMAGWTWDGEALRDQNGEEVALTTEAS